MSGTVKSFRDLKAWQRAMDIVPRVYQFAAALPREERFVLGDQMRRAAVSVPTNIAEGHARQYTREFLQHLSIARGSLAELHTLLLVAQRLGYCMAADLETIEQAITEVRMILFGLMTKLKEKL